MEGWIKLYRKFLNWEWYKDNNVKIIFLHLLLTANHKDKKWKGKTIKKRTEINFIKSFSRRNEFNNSTNKNCN